VTCTQRQEQTLSGLERIRAAAAKDKNLRFTSLMHHNAFEADLDTKTRRAGTSHRHSNPGG
jgi:hypothetical protein